MERFVLLLGGTYVDEQGDSSPEKLLIERHLQQKAITISTLIIPSRDLLFSVLVKTRY